MGSCVQLYSLAETPQLSPLPQHLGSYTKALLISQDRRHLFVTPWPRRTAPNTFSLLLVTGRNYLETAPPDRPTPYSCSIGETYLEVCASGRTYTSKPRLRTDLYVKAAPLGGLTPKPLHRKDLPQSRASGRTFTSKPLHLTDLPRSRYT